MRIIAGAARGRRLTSPPGEETRPTLDRVREAIFSSLSPYLYDAAAEFLNQRMLMRYHQDGSSAAVYLIEHIDYLKAHARVNVARGLVRDYHRWIVYQRSRESDTLLLTAGKLLRQTASLVIESDEAEDVRHLLADSLGAGSCDSHGKCNVVEYVHIGDETEVLEHHAH